MDRFRDLASWMGLGCLLAAVVVARADESQQPVRDIRMWHVGNSWSCPFPFEAVGLPRAFVHHTHNFGRPTEELLTTGWIGETLNRDRGKTNVLEKGDFDVVYLGFAQLSGPIDGLDQLFDIVQKHKPGARIYLQHAWAPGRSVCGSRPTSRRRSSTA